MSTALTVTDPNTGLLLASIESDPKLRDSTKHQYKKAVLNYVAAGHNLLDADALNGYAQTVGSSTRAFLSAAVKRLCKAIAHKVKSCATPGNIGEVQATIFRVEAMAEAIKVEQSKGEKVHIWLNQSQVRELMATCDTKTITGQRDRLALGLLCGAGLRRLEAANLRFEDVKLQPKRGGGFRTVLEVRGKGSKNRVVPISDSLASAIRQWSEVVGGEGYILRSLNHHVGDSMSTVAIFKVVRARGKLIGINDLSPHDLRRSYSQIGYEAGVPITQLSVLLGHSSVNTTQKYLCLDLDLETTASDHVPF